MKFADIPFGKAANAGLCYDLNGSFGMKRAQVGYVRLPLDIARRERVQEVLLGLLSNVARALAWYHGAPMVIIHGSQKRRTARDELFRKGRWSVLHGPERLTGYQYPLDFVAFRAAIDIVMVIDQNMTEIAESVATQKATESAELVARNIQMSFSTKNTGISYKNLTFCCCLNQS